MAAKCDYSSKYKPLVEAKRLELANTPGAFQNWIKTVFNNPDYVMSVIDTPPQQLSEINITAHKLMENKPQDIESIKSEFGNNSTAYNKCISDFGKSIVEASIFNRNDNKWIDAEALNENGITTLNSNLFKYKLDLIHTIEIGLNKNFGSDININDENADEKLTLALYSAIAAVDTAVGINTSPQILEAYVILKNFNKLISDKTPFIKVKKEYENTTAHGVNMYVYSGPNVKHRVSWTNSEHVSAESQYSDLSKILLDYFPEFNGFSEIPGTSIGTEGFITVMNKFRTALLYSDDPLMSKHRADFYEGNFNITKALNDYLLMVKDATKSKIVREQITTQINKLQGIIHYIFESELSDDVKEMFKGMFEKTTPLSYMTYTWKNGKFGAVNLVDSFVNTKMLDLQDTVNGRVAQLRGGAIINGKTEFQRILDTWGIKVDPSTNTITISPDKEDFTITLVGNKTVTKNYNSYEVTVNVNNSIDDGVLGAIITDVLGTYLPLETYSEISQYVNDKGSLLNDFADVLLITLLAGNPNTTSFDFTPLNVVDNSINFKTLHLFTNFEKAARTLSVIYGSETRNVVNDINGNHLPTNGLTSMMFNSPMIAAEMCKQSYEDYEDPFAWNILGPKKDFITGSYGTPGFYSPIIRQGVKMGGKTKPVSQLTLGELLEIGAIYDFYDNIAEKENVIYLQNTNVADKERHPIIPFILRDITLDGKKYDMKSLLQDVAAGKIKSDELIEVWQTLRNHRYTAIANNVLHDYSEVFDIEFKSLAQLDSYLEENPMTMDVLRKKFRDKKINFKEEVHASKLGDYARVNEVLYHLQDAFSTREKAERRLDKSRAYFANDMFKTRLKINRYTNSVIGKNWNSISDDWKEKRGKVETGNLILFKIYDGNKEIKVSSSDPSIITNPKYKVVLNPIFESYLLADIIYSNEYNQLHVGDVFSHPIKDKAFSLVENGWDSSEFYDACEATRLVAQNKRAVIYGASIHSFQHDLANNRGVADEIDIAVIEDMPAAVWNMIGGLKDKSIDDFIDSMDGSGLQSIYEAILEQESLKDAAAGVDEKTILGWNDKYFGRQILLKWAVYALTNERRRLSNTSVASAENLFRRMHNRVFNKFLDMSKLWRKHVDHDIYFKDFESRKTYKILGVETVTTGDYKRVQVRKAIEVNSDGNPVSNQEYYLTNRNKLVTTVDNINDFTYNTLYDLDQFFGGAYEMSLVDGQLKYTDTGNHIVADIICEEDLKNYFIAYAVNKSAVKAGTENLNSADLWTNNDPLDTMRMSTKYGGLQMNAEHELEDSEVSEMTQMISALIEKGFSWELVKQIYSDIGDVVLESLKSFKTGIKNYGSDPNRLKVMLGKALIDAYSRGDRDTLGLAQAFLGKAERILRENDVNFKFPFSGATIHGSFIATVSSLLTKKGIRRKYSGIACVLTPSYNMIQIYGNGETLEKYADYIAEWKTQPGNERFANTNIYDLINNVEVVNSLGIKELNPFIKLDANKTFDFEDTIIINTAGVLTPIIIDSFEKYDKYKHYDGDIYIWKSRPRNLKGANTKYRFLSQDGKADTVKHSIYEWTSVRAANYSIKKSWSKDEESVIFTAIRHMVSSYASDIVFNDGYDNAKLLKAFVEGTITKTYLQSAINVRKSLYNMVQRQLRQLEDEHALTDILLTNGVRMNVANVEVEAAEIIMGKLFAKQFLLQEGDDVQSILKDPDFFYNRLSAKYNPNVSVPKNQYDAVVFTEDGEKIIVKIDSDLDYKYDKSSNPNITKVDGKVFLNQKELCYADNKAFFQVKGDDGKLYNLIVLKSTDDFAEFVKSKTISNFSINYENDVNTAIQLTLDTNDDIEITIDGQTFDIVTLLQIDRSILADALRLKEQELFKNRLRRHSNRMAESFGMALNFIGTRIPAQAMQSFQPMKVVAFTDSETNDVYVNRFNTYIEGSDYDIDKSYILGYEVNSDGLVETGSNLAKWLGIEAALSLEVAKGRRFEEGENGTFITLNTLDSFLQGDVETINSVLKSNNTTLSFEQPNGLNEKAQRRLERRIKKMIDYLNLHERSYQSEGAIKNRVVHGIRKVALSPKNQINFHSPIGMETQQNAAKRSDLGKDELNINIDTPSSKFMMQQQNMVGKQCIGITAVAIKCFFAKSEYYNDLLNQIPDLLNAGADSQILNMLESLVFKNPITGNISLLANVNLYDIFDKVPMGTKLNVQAGENSLLNHFNTDDGRFDLMQCLHELQEYSNRVDAAMELSGLLSAATDNAKELILAKINATSKFIDLYTVAIQCGSTFEEISNIMMSPIFNSVSRLADNNIFKRYEGSYKLETAIKFYLNQGLLPGVNQRLLLRIFRDKLGTTDVKIEDIYSYLEQTDLIESWIETAYSGANNEGKNSNLSEDGYILDEYSEVTLTRSDWLSVANFLEEVVDRNRTKERLKKRYKDYDKQIANLELVLTQLIPAADEQNILGRMLGINQGLSTSGYKQYNDIFTIESFIKTRTGDTDFDLLTFISDDAYKDEWIKKYEAVKSYINILDVISKVPHFKEMFNIVYDNDFILSNLSARYQLTKELANRISGDKYPLREKEFKQVGYYINDLFLVSFLTSMNKQIIVPKGVKYYNGTKNNPVTAEVDTSVSLDSLHGLASFKIWMENYVIPMLKNDYDYHDNPFIAALSYVNNTNSITGKKSSYYKLPLNMLTIDHNTGDRQKYEIILKGFKNIANDSIGGWKVSDLFYVYNAIVNKDSIGQKSMTRIFEDLVDSPSNSYLVSAFYDFVSDIDSNSELRKKFIDTALSTYGEKDSKFYIKQNVPDTFIRSSEVWIKPEDYTFPMPSMDGTWYANRPKVDDQIESISSYNYGLTNRDVLESLASELSNRYGQGLIQVHSQRWFNDNFGDNPDLLTNPAFIKDGVIYVNENKADVTDVLHEYTHLLLATIKANENYQPLYYRLMEEIRNHQNYDILAKPYRGRGIIGTDLDEEVLVKVIQQYFRNRIAGWSGENVLMSNQSTILSALNEILGTNIDDKVDISTIMNSTSINLIKKFGSSIFNLHSELDLSQSAMRWRIRTQELRTLVTTGPNPEVEYKCD